MPTDKKVIIMHKGTSEQEFIITSTSQQVYITHDDELIAIGFDDDGNIEVRLNPSLEYDFDME